MNVLFRFLTIYYSLVSFIKRKVLIKNIKKDDLVLDVGSGDKPHWRADVIVDKYPEDNQQRISGGVLFDKRKLFVNADVENLPFKDKSFDFVFCSHLLEHVKNPDKAIKEITRIGKAGYIEVPSGILELWQPFKTHLWLCDYGDNKLIFYRKENKKNLQDQIFTKFGRKYFNSPLFQYLIAKDINNFFICLYWAKTINYRIENSFHPYVYSYEKIKKSYLKFNLNFYSLFYYLMALLFYRKKKYNFDKIKKTA